MGIVILTHNCLYDNQTIKHYTVPVEVPLRQEVAGHPQEVHDDVELVDGAVVADGGRDGGGLPGYGPLLVTL